MSLGDLPKNNQVNLIHYSHSACGFYYKHPSVELYLLRLILSNKNSILVMTKMFSIQFPRRSGRSAFFTFDFVISKFFTYFLTFIQVNNIQPSSSLAWRRKDVLLFAINWHKTKFHSYAGVTNLVSKNNTLRMFWLSNMIFVFAGLYSCLVISFISDIIFFVVLF